MIFIDDFIDETVCADTNSIFSAYIDVFDESNNSNSWNIVFPDNNIGSLQVNPSPFFKRNVFRNNPEGSFYDPYFECEDNKVLKEFIFFSFKNSFLHENISFIKHFRVEFYPIMLQTEVTTPPKVTNKKGLDFSNEYTFILPLIESDSKLHYNGDVYEMNKNQLITGIKSDSEFRIEYGGTKYTALLVGAINTYKEL